MLEKEENLLESVIHITEERDKKSLIKVLVEVLSDFISFDAIILLQVPRGTDANYLEAAASIPKNAWRDRLRPVASDSAYQRVDIDEYCSRAIESRDVVQASDADISRVIFPIIVNDLVMGILNIYGHNQSESTEKLIRGFIRIYSNFIPLAYPKRSSCPFSHSVNS